MIDQIHKIYQENIGKGFESDLSEYRAINEWLQGRTFHNFIEIGSAWGASFHLWSLHTDGLKISIDLPDPYPTVRDFSARDALWRSYFTDVYPIVGDSTHQETVDRVAEILNGDLIDFLYIDADHTYDGCMSDYKMWKHFVRPNGYIGFHDVLASQCVGSNRVWTELTDNLSPEQYHLCQGRDGIGIIQV